MSAGRGAWDASWPLVAAELRRLLTAGHCMIARGACQMPRQQRLDVSEVGDVTVVHFRDQRIIEDLGIQEMGQELFHLVEGEDRKKLILNFSAVGFVSSAALGKLITLDKKVKARGGVLTLCSIRPEIYEVFAITRLDRLFDIKADESEALAAFCRLPFVILVHLLLAEIH